MKTISRLLAGIALAVVSLAACQDDELISVPQPSGPSTNVGTRATNATSSLVQNEDGTWTATRRVPLVGRGRIVDDIANALVSVLSTNSSLENIVDEDLTNAATFNNGAAAVNLLANQLVSVRDVHHTYAAGQTVGFAFKIADSGLLKADVLKGFWLQTLKDGTPQESFGGDLSVEVLKLSVVNISSTDDAQSIQEVSFKTTKDFDEVKFNIYGITADVLNSLELYYAFVGDNEIKTATQGSVYFPDAELHENDYSHIDLGWTAMLDAEKVVNNNPSDYAFFSILQETFNDPCITVRFNKEVPAGSEVGFEMSNVDLLSIKIGASTTLATYNDNDEEQDKVTIASLIGISAVSGNRSRVSMITTKPCTQLYFKSGGLNLTVGGTSVYYAYARDAVQVDASSYFSLTDVTITGTSYTLSTNQNDGSTTTWVLLNSVAGTQPDIITDETTGVTKIIGMMKDGDYTLSGTYTPAGGGTPITQTFTITRKTQQQGQSCNQMITSSGEYAGEIASVSGGGSLITLDNIEGKENLLTPNADDYATYIGGLSLLAKIPIMAIKLDNPIQASAAAPVNTGFTMQTHNLFLGADVLKCFIIKVYNDNTLVKETVTTGSNLADVSLIGDRANKVRIGTTVDAPFNQIELWTGGVLSLNISEYRLYNAYWELASETCYTGQPTDACIEMLTPAAHGAEINYRETYIGLDEGTGSVASVGGTIKNLSNMLDEDKDSPAELIYTNVIGEASLAIKFDPLPAGTQTGFIIKNENYLADVGLRNGTILDVYKDGTLQVSTAEGDVLGLDVISFAESERIYVETAPNVPFDEIRLRLPGVANVLSNTYVYGAYIRRDSDNDGIPDCAEEEENPEEPVESLTAQIEGGTHICEDGVITIKVTEGGKEGENYELVCYNTWPSTQETTFIRELSDEKTFTLTGEEMGTGKFFIRIQQGGKNVTNVALEAFVHPAETTWKKEGTTRGEWNNWNNWTNGAPWSCTNVIIPGGCSDYPVLTATEDNYCANLHIGAGAELVNTQYLTGYDYAWVELSLQANNYYMLSAPLQSMATGDMFVPSGWNFGNAQPEYFTKLTPMNAPESRFTPRVYQRFWSSEVPGMVIDGEGNLKEEILVSETDWTAPFNAVAEPYAKGMGFSLRVNNTATCRFPKTHEEYTYFDAAGNSTGQRESVGRRNVGRFWTDSWTSGENFTVTVANRTAGTTFVVGNPFMAHISIEQLLKTNPGIKAVRLNDGNANATIMLADDGTLATENGYTYIAPMQAFYVDVETESTTLTVNFNTGMLSAQPGYQIVSAQDTGAKTRALTRSAAAADGTPRNTLRLTATCNGRSSSCLVRLQPTANDGYLGGEDSRLLIDGDMPPTVAVFTTADGLALDIQQRSSREDIPVGFRLPKAGHVTLALSHQAGDDWSQWTLVDSRTGQRYPLEDGYTHIDLGTLDTCAGRFYLEH